LNADSFELKSLDTTLFNRYFEYSNFKPIFEDSNLFLIAFCKIFPKDNSNFEIIETDNLISFKAVRGSGYFKALPLALEQLRPFFANGFISHQNFEFCAIQWFDYGFFRELSDTIDCREHTFHHYAGCYDRIALCMQAFTALFSATYKKCTKNLPVKFSTPHLVKTSVSIIQVRWKDEVHATYKIAPKLISKPLDLRQMLYSEYLEGKNCDYQLIVKDDFVIHLHEFMFRLHTGEPLKALFNLKTKESKSQVFYLKEFSRPTVQAFIMFIYLGAEEFENALMSEKFIKVDILELLSFAHCHQEFLFMDCCINYLNRFCKKSDADTILEEAKLYDNEYLLDIHKTLTDS